jgi:hypothetical protein
MAGFAILTLVLMDRSTVDSMTPRPADLPAVDLALAKRLSDLGVDDVAQLRDLLSSPAGSENLPIPADARARLAEQVELALLSGIGARNAAALIAAGVETVDDLARIDGAELERRLRTVDPERRPRPARLRVWIRSAQARIH